MTIYRVNYVYTMARKKMYLVKREVFAKSIVEAASARGRIYEIVETFNEEPNKNKPGFKNNEPRIRGTEKKD